ncbi:MAG TPA: DUF4457 domain-containing protein [Planctomycetaceae bacterium]|nr:DUF4457 domain-containing protein [Planctomycetaceae bacterium]
MSTRLVCFIAAALFVAGTLVGCGSESSNPKGSTKSTTDKPTESSPNAMSNAASSKAPAATTNKATAPSIEEQLAPIQADIDGKNWDRANEKLAALRQSLGEAPAADRLAKLSSIEKLLTEHRDEMRRYERMQLLESAKSAYANGEWDQSLKQIDAVAALAPGESEREELTTLRASINKAMKAQLGLASWIKMLGSSSSGEVKTAQTQLMEEPEAALPLVRQAISQHDPVTTKNALEFLRKLRKPDIALPIMVSVLEDPAQQASWEIAGKEIVRLDHPGAGPKLIQLVRTSTIPEQRIAAISALAKVVDPPEDTELILLPFLFQDGPELAALISACTHSVVVNHHHDLLEWRALAESVTETQTQQLSQIGERLKALQSLPAEQQATIDAARQLALALQMMTPKPIQGAQILEATPTDPTIKPTALLDGVWNTIDLASMWWTPVAQQGYVVIDLGGPKTVTGVRIWNFNENGGGYRGWKDVEVFVSDTPTALRPVSQRSLLPAPGIADPLDYSQIIPVDFAQGRYVKLVCKEYLSQNSYAGLTEIQILGY